MIGENKSALVEINSWSMAETPNRWGTRKDRNGVPATYGADEGAFQAHVKIPNLIFADGHAKSIPLPATVLPNDMWSLDLDNPVITLTQRQSYVASLRPEYK